MKTALLRSSKQSDWFSVQVLSTQLAQSYQMTLEQDLFSYVLNEEDLGASIEKLVSDAQKKQVEALVLIDNRPFPSLYLPELLKECLRQDFQPQVHIHLYGCARFWLNELIPYDYLLKKFKFLFFAPSKAQEKFLAQFLPPANIQKIFFPFTNPIFSPVSLEDKLKLRQSLHLKTEAFYLIYSGRLHLQKNIDLLLLTLKELKKTKPESKLIICGSFDHSAISMLHPRKESFDILSQFYTLLEALELKDQVLWKDHLSQDELANFFKASDVFISLSTYNDEDYGSAPLEALHCGLPAILSSWGGYREYHSPYTKLIPITRQDDELILDLDEVLKAISDIPVEESSFEIAQHFQQQFSAQKFGKEVLKSTANDFQGFSHQSQNLLENHFPFDQKGLHRKDYLNFYKSYYQ